MPDRPAKPKDVVASPRFKQRNGTGQTKRKTTLQDLARRPPTAEEFSAYLSEVETGSARSVVVLLTAHLENVLRFTILSRFIHLPATEVDRLCDRSGPMGSFSQLISIGFAMGIYGKQTRRNLDTVRRIRNGFAHTLIPLEFDTREVAQEIDTLDFLETIVATVETNDPRVAGETFASLVLKRVIFGDNRSRFIETCRFLSSKLMDEIDFKRRASAAILP